MAKGIGFALIGFLIVIVGIGAFMAGKKGVSPSGTLSTSTPISTPTPEGETVSIKQAVYEKLNSDATKLEVTVSKIEGDYAKGGVVGVGSKVGGGYFLAAKTKTGWVEVYDGQANPTCLEIAPYDFPTDMVPECMDANNNLITR